jgi:hypothetical protein
MSQCVHKECSYYSSGFYTIFIRIIFMPHSSWESLRNYQHFWNHYETRQLDQDCKCKQAEWLVFDPQHRIFLSAIISRLILKPTQYPCTTGVWGCFACSIVNKMWGWALCPYSGEVENTWSYTYFPHIVMMLYLMQHWNTFNSQLVKKRIDGMCGIQTGY